MVPLPSAVKLPTLAINAPGLALASVPLIEKEYVPCRFAFVKFPVAGGGVGLDDPLPPHETVSNASAPAATTRSRLTAHPADRRIYRQAAAENLARCAARASDYPSE